MALLRDYHAAIGEIIIKYNGTLELGEGTLADRGLSRVDASRFHLDEDLFRSRHRSVDLDDVQNVYSDISVKLHRTRHWLSLSQLQPSLDHATQRLPSRLDARPHPRTSFHHQPEAQHPKILQLSTRTPADYPILTSGIEG
jgi:hypothetical protein